MSKNELEMYDLGHEQGIAEAFEMVFRALHSRWAKLPNGHYRKADEWAEWLMANKADILKGKLKG